MSHLFFTSLLAFQGKLLCVIQVVPKFRLIIENNFFGYLHISNYLLTRFPQLLTKLHSEFLEGTLRSNPFSQHLLLLLVGFTKTPIVSCDFCKGLSKQIFVEITLFLIALRFLLGK